MSVCGRGEQDTYRMLHRRDLSLGTQEKRNKADYILFPFLLFRYQTMTNHMIRYAYWHIVLSSEWLSALFFLPTTNSLALHRFTELARQNNNHREYAYTELV